jgi:hypothetical protein
MAVRYLAHELYRLTRRVEELEAALAALAPDAPLSERTRLDNELRKARKERDHFRAMLEAKKEKPLV